MGTRNFHPRAKGFVTCADAAEQGFAGWFMEVLDGAGTGAAPDNATPSIGTLCWAVRPESVSRFRRCKSARISAACW